MKNFSLRLFLSVLLASVGWFSAITHAASPTISPATQDAKVQRAVVEDKVNINTASADALAELLTGIGPKKAEAIVAYREANGPFKTVDDLLNVKGVGPATLDKNRDRISL